MAYYRGKDIEKQQKIRLKLILFRSFITNQCAIILCNVRTCNRSIHYHCDRFQPVL